MISLSCCFQSGRPALKVLCREILNVKVQQGEHSSVSHRQRHQSAKMFRSIQTTANNPRTPFFNFLWTPVVLLSPRSKTLRPPWGSTRWWRNIGRQRLKPVITTKTPQRKKQGSQSFPRTRTGTSARISRDYEFSLPHRIWTRAAVLETIERFSRLIPGFERHAPKTGSVLPEKTGLGPEPGNQTQSFYLPFFN